MPNDFIRLPTDGAGKHVRTFTFTEGGNAVHVHYFAFSARPNRMWGIMEGMVDDTEEIRFDLQDTSATNIYVGAAPAGSLETALAWDIVRTELNAAGKPTRRRLRTAIAWSDRTVGW